MLSFLKGFKIRLMLTILLFSIVSLISFSMYFFKNQTNSMLTSDFKEQQSVNQMLAELMDASYYRHVYFTLSSLQGIRHKHAAAASSIRNIYIATGSDKLDSVGPLVRSILNDSLTEISYRVIIFDQDNPEQSIFVKPEFREILKYRTIQSLSLEQLLKDSTFTQDVYFVYLQDPDTKEEFISSITMMNKHTLIVLVSNLNSLMELRSSVRRSIVEHIKLPLERMNSGFSKNRWQHYVLDRTGKVIEPNTMNIKLDFTHELVQQIKQAPNQTITASMTLNDEPSQFVISLYRPLNWYIVASIPESNILKSQKDLSKNIIYICAVVALITLLCTYFLASSISRPLNLLTTSTHEIAKIDLRNTNEIKGIIRKLNLGDRRDEIGEISKVLSQMIFSLSLNMNRLLDTQNRQKLVEGELSAAADIQQGLLPNDLDLPEFLPLDIYGFLTPAKEVGGDLYDVVALPDHKLCIAIGDVSDKGVPAALFMTMTVTLIREGVSLHLSPAQLMNSVNQTLCQRNPNMMFVTLFIGILDKKTGDLIYANGGHCQPLLISWTKGIRALTELSGPAVGVVEDMEYKEFADRIAPDETLFLYTDGVTEAQNVHKELFGEDRLSEFLMKHANLSAEDLSLSLTEHLAKFKGDAPQFDDITMLTVRRKKSS